MSPSPPRRRARFLGLAAGLFAGLAPAPGPAADLSGELRIARAYIDSSRYDDAIRSLKGILQQDPRNAEARYLTGKVFMAGKQVPRARENFKRALQLDPTHQDAAKAVVALVAAEARTGGVTVYKKALDEGFYLPPFVREVIQAYAARRRYPQALAVAEKFAEKLEAGQVADGFRKRAAEALLLAAKVAQASKARDKAWDLLERARGQHSGVDGLRELSTRLREDLISSATPAKLRGDSLALKGRYDQALAEYDKALAIFPKWGPPKQAALEVNALAQAEALYSEALELITARKEPVALRKLLLAGTKPPQSGDLMTRGLEVLRKIETKRAELEAAAADRKSAAAARQAAFAAAYDEGNAAAKDERWADAVTAYEKAAELSPQDQRVEEKLTEARKRADLAKTFAEGKAAFRKKQYNAALASFDAVLATRPDDTQLLKMLALTHFNIGRAELEARQRKAAAAGDGAPPMDPSLPPGYTKAEQLAQGVLSGRRDREMFYVLGVINEFRAQTGQAKPITAIRWFQKIEQESPDYRDISERLQGLRWRQNRVPLIAGALGAVFIGIMLFWNKHRPTIYKNRFLGRVEKYAAKGKWEALAALEPEARSYPLDKTQDLAVATAMAQAFYHRKQWQKAISWGQLALSKSRENPALVVLLGRIYFEGQVISQDILRYLIALSEAEPENVELMRFIGEFCLDKQVVNDDTMPILRNLAAVMPQHDKLRRMLIRGYLRTEDRGARAMALYRAELAKDPDRIDIRYYVAEDSLRAGRTEEAIEHAEKILNIRLNHPQTHDLLLRAYGKLGKLDELARIYQGILEADPYNPAVQESLKKILAKG